MRVAAIYDIHGNLPALEAVLAEVVREEVDRLLVGGDVIPGPMPHETIACLRDLSISTQLIQGNGDREVLAQRKGIASSAIPESFRESMRWNAQQLAAEDKAWLQSWPATAHLRIDGIGEVLFCHASPRNDTDVFTRLTPEDQLARIFAGVKEPTIVCGHSHMQFDRTIGQVRVINAGSVGMPFGQAGAYWLLLGPKVELRRTEYDFAEAARRIRETKYPQAEQFAAGNVLQPPSEKQMLEAFANIHLT